MSKGDRKTGNHIFFISSFRFLHKILTLFHYILFFLRFISIAKSKMKTEKKRCQLCNFIFSVDITIEIWETDGNEMSTKHSWIRKADDTVVVANMIESVATCKDYALKLFGFGKCAFVEHYDSRTPKKNTRRYRFIPLQNCLSSNLLTRGRLEKWNKRKWNVEYEVKRKKVMARECVSEAKEMRNGVCDNE